MKQNSVYTAAPLLDIRSHFPCSSPTPSSRPLFRFLPTSLNPSPSLLPPPSQSIHASTPPTIHLTIKPPLQPHPPHRPTRHYHRSRQRRSPLRSPEHPPLTHKMTPRNHIRQERHLIDLRVRDIVSGIETHDGLDDGPGAECAC